MSQEDQLLLGPGMGDAGDLADADHEEEAEGPSWTAFLVLGIFSGMALGAITVMLLKERQRALAGLNGPYQLPMHQMPQLPPAPQVIVPPINIWNVGAGYGAMPGTMPSASVPTNQFVQHNQTPSVPSQKIPAPANFENESDYASTSASQGSRMGTATISSFETTTLMKATGGVGWTVQVRTVGPPGRYGYFATDSNTIAMQGAPADAIAVPAGQFHDIYLQPGETLFARGSVPLPTSAQQDDVVVSFSGRALA